MRNFFQLLIVWLCLLSVALSLRAQIRQPESTGKAVYISFAEARPVVSTLAEILPAPLRGKSDAEIEAIWPNWVARYDTEIRARLAQGDEDSLVNFLLFGTSFTRHPRVTLSQLQSIKIGATNFDADSQVDPTSRLVALRINDLVRASAAPGNNDRLHFAGALFEQKGFRLGATRGRSQAEQYLWASLARVIKENTGYSRVLEAARLQGDATEEFAQRSRLFRSRGLSSDASLLPNYAIEEALKDLKARGLLTSSKVFRVAVIGPGLDFADKQEGYDFYPQQTIQPFAVMDTLLRLNLATADSLQLFTFDLSPRVNSHIVQARQRASRGRGYLVQLPRDMQAPWTPGVVRYWEQFGNQIGSPVRPSAFPGTAGELRVRAVRIRPAFLSRLSPVDTNIVLQRPELSPSERFDLIIATNILVYYDTFDQSLAMMNVERMLKPGGFLLSNNAVLELPFFRVKSAGYSPVAYSSRPNDGDHIVWYRRSPD